MKPLHIVLAMIDPPLPFGGAASRGYYVLLRGLVERGHRVTAFATCDRFENIEASRALFPAPEFDLRLYPTTIEAGLLAKWRTLRQPFSYMFSERFRDDFRTVLTKGFDILHLEQLWSAWLGEGFEHKALISLHYLLEIDMADALPATLSDWRYRKLETLAERRLLRRYHYYRACTDRLAAYARLRNPKADVSTVPFGLDARLYPYREDRHGPSDPVVTLIGKMTWLPNCSAAERLLTRLWPSIKQQIPLAKLAIVGWGAREVLAASGFNEMPDVTVLQDVPDTRPYFEAASVLLYAPGRGSGMKVKVQEAMAYGVPVVTTSEGVEGLPALDGIHAGICDDDEGLVRRTVALLSDTAQQNRHRFAARQMIEKVCDPTATLDGIEAIYDRMRKANHSTSWRS